MANKKIAGITVEIGGDTTKLGKALNDVDKQSRNLKDELKQVDKALKLDPKNTEILTQKQQILADAIQNSKKKLDTLKSAQEQVTAQYQRGEIDDGKFRAFQREVETAKLELSYFEDAAKKAKSETDNLSGKLSTVKDDFKKAGENIEKAGDKVTAFGEGIEKAGDKALIASGIIAGAATASYKAWEKTDEGYDTIVKKTGATGEALEELKGVADNVFTSLPVDMAKVGTAVGEINTRFGSTGDELESLTEAFLKYSEINDSDVNGSVDNVSAAMTAFGVGSDKTGDVLNKLTSISQRTGISASQLESVLLSQSATFKEMGLSIGESAELLGQFEKNGVDTSTAIASLRKAQQNAAAGGKTLSDELQKNITDIKNAKNDTEALQIATELFGKKGAAAMAQAIREDRISLDTLNSTLYDTKDTVNKTFEATLDAPDKLKVAMNQVKLEASDLAAVAMEKLAPALKKVTDKIKGLTEKFNKLSDGEKETILKLAGIAAAIGPVLILIGKLTSGVGGLISSVGSLFKLAAVNPWVLAIGAVVAALAVLYVKNEDFREFVNETAAEILDFIKEIGAELKQWYEDNKPLIDDIIKVLKVLSEVLIQYVMKAARDTMNGFKLAWTIISATWSVATSFFKTIWENIKLIFSVVKDVLTGDFSGAWEGIKQIFSNTGEFFEGVWSSIKSVFSGVGEWFDGKFTAARTYIKGAFKGLGSFFGATKDEMLEAFESFPDALAEIFRKALEKIKEIAGEIGDTISGVVDKIPGVSSVKKGVSSLASKIPFLASGGTLSKNGDAAVVGEAGPELLRLLNGKAVVTPLSGDSSQPKPAVAESTQTSPNRTVVHQTFNIYPKTFSTPQDARTTSQELAKLQRQTDFGKGVIPV
jgi:TP901 family phage tail tape measure protein